MRDKRFSRRTISAALCSLAIFLMVLGLFVSSQSPVLGAADHNHISQLTTPSTPSATLVPGAFDLSTATVFKAPADVIEILLPKAWQNVDEGRTDQYSFVLGDPSQPTVEIHVWIDTLANLFDGQTIPADPKAALGTISDNFKQQNSQSGSSAATVSDVTDTTIGTLPGFMFSYSTPDSANGPGATGEFRAAQLSVANKVVLVRVQGSNAAWNEGKTVLHQMINSLVINAGSIPTATPTNTPMALEVTLTAIATQVNAIETKIAALTPNAPLPLSLSPTAPLSPTEQATSCGATSSEQGCS